LVFEAAGNVVVSWTSPLSDGGAAISAYSATLGGNPCVLATPTDTTCTITAPTAAGTYPIDVKAQNASGYGASITSNFTRAAVASTPTVGGGQTVNPGSDEMRVLGFSLKTIAANGGQILLVRAVNMDDIQQVFVDGSPAKIISTGSGQLQILMPAHIPGNANITFIGPKGRLDFIDAVTYASTGKIKLLITSISNLIERNSSLSAAMKKTLKTLVAAHPNAVSATCVGYQSLSYNLPIDAKVALDRATNACNYLKSLNPKLAVKAAIGRTSLTGPASRKLEIQLKDPTN
jgi:hypothetical protein